MELRVRRIAEHALAGPDAAISPSRLACIGQPYSRAKRGKHRKREMSRSHGREPETLPAACRTTRRAPEHCPRPDRWNMLLVTMRAPAASSVFFRWVPACGMCATAHADGCGLRKKSGCQRLAALRLQGPQVMGLPARLRRRLPGATDCEWPCGNPSGLCCLLPDAFS